MFTSIIGTTFVVAGIVVALFFALLTIERAGLLGVLKAVGASSRTLVAGLTLQAVLSRWAPSCGQRARPRARSAIPEAVPLELSTGRSSSWPWASWSSR